MRAFRVVPFTVAFNQEYCFEVAVAELKRQVAGLVSQMKAQGVPSGVPTPKSAGLPPGGGGPWEEPLPRERAKKKKPIQPADVEQQPGVAGLPQADAAARAAAKQEANRAALALRSRSPVMIPRKSVATPKQVPEQKHRTREDEKAAKHKATWLDNIPSDSGRGRGGGPPGGDDDGDSSGDGGGRKGGRRSPSSSDSSGDGDDDDSRDDRRGKVRASLVVPPKKEKKKDKRKKEESRSDRRGKRGRSKERKKKKDKHKDKKERDKKRKRRTQRSSRSSSRSSSSETGSLERLYGKETKKFDTLAEKARKHPGRLLQVGLEEMRKYMLARTGESGTEQSWRQQRVGAYIQQVLFVRHNPSQIGVRNTREILTLSAALDALLEEDFPLVGDLLMQRLKARGWPKRQERKRKERKGKRQRWKAQGRKAERKEPRKGQEQVPSAGAWRRWKEELIGSGETPGSMRLWTVRVVRHLLQMPSGIGPPLRRLVLSPTGSGDTINKAAESAGVSLAFTSRIPRSFQIHFGRFTVERAQAQAEMECMQGGLVGSLGSGAELCLRFHKQQYRRSVRSPEKGA